MKKQDFKYVQVYEHFKKLIEEGEISRGDKMPSLISCSQELSVSKTTAENAYFQLAADGYIISRERSGYYVTGRGRIYRSSGTVENQENFDRSSGVEVRDERADRIYRSSGTVENQENFDRSSGVEVRDERADYIYHSSGTVENQKNFDRSSGVEVRDERADRIYCSSETAENQKNFDRSSGVEVHDVRADRIYRSSETVENQEDFDRRFWGEGADMMSDYALTGARDPIYDMAKMGDDPSAFRFDLWQRYLKSAIRHKERMVLYGEPQGETELREAISEYVRKRRNIYCSPERIVIGASTQSLLMLLLPLLKSSGVRTASVPARGFERYAQVFQTHDLKVDIRRKDADIIYVSPSHMTVWGEVMTLKRRYEILEHSRSGHLIIEDDYQNEFVFSRQGCPSIYSLSCGENVVYLGSFSRLLLPSIRISFMILPTELLPAYKILSHRYDQTASKIEQLALCSYLRDDHMYRQIKKLRKTYAAKRALLYEILNDLTGDLEDLTIRCGDCGTEMAVYGGARSIFRLGQRLEKLGIACRRMNGYSDEEKILLLFTCGMIEQERLKELANGAAELLHRMKMPHIF